MDLNILKYRYSTPLQGQEYLRYKWLCVFHGTYFPRTFEICHLCDREIAARKRFLRKLGKSQQGFWWGRLSWEKMPTIQWRMQQQWLCRPILYYSKVVVTKHDYLHHYQLHLHQHHCHGLPAYSHHDKIPPWFGNVSNDKGGNVSVSNSHHSW